MPKKIVLALLILLLGGGCSIKKLEPSNLDTTLNIVLSKESTLFNRVGSGYKYYLPKGIRVIEVQQYNEKLYSKNNIYYLYLDIVSYYYNKVGNYKRKEGVYYSEVLNYNGKEGYIEIQQKDNKYYVEMLYNYAKMEAIVKKEELRPTIINFSYILKSITYNQEVIQTLFENNKFDSPEEYFKIFQPRRREGNFLDYVNEYDYYEDEEGIMPSDSIITE